MNGSSIPQQVQIHLNGVSNVKRDAALITLRGTTPEDTNSIRDPNHILPVTTTIHNAGATFEHTMPAYSIQVLDIQAQ